MTQLYYPHMEAVGCLFCAALCGYLLWVSKRTKTVRASYLRCLIAVAAAGFLDVVQCVLMNLDHLNPQADYPLTALFSAVQFAELMAAAFFLFYALDQAAASDRFSFFMRRAVTVLTAAFVAAQVVNLFTHSSHYIDADGVITAGPLYVWFVFVYPGIYFAAGFFVFFIYRRHYTKTNATVILAALLITVAGMLFQGLVMPSLTTATFGASIAVFLLYFSLETPPFVELRQRLAEMEQAELVAEQEKRKALQEDRDMNDFLANMSHEIRTPLTAILGYDEVILRNAREEDVKEYAQDILNAGNTLLYIVGDILDFSKIESGDLTLSVGEYHLRNVLDNLGNMIRKKARDKGLEYRTDIDNTIPDCLIGDGIRISQILLNVLNNAVKYTEHGYTQLKLRAKRMEQPDKILLVAEIEDTGIGIRKEDMANLFRAFSRFEETRNAAVEGTGLGLAITSRLLKLMDGTIEAESTYGKGSKFKITIPQQVAGTQTIGMYEDGASVHSQSVREELLAPEGKLLVVDDNLTNRTVVGELLSRTLMRIDTADGGESCLKMVKETAYDIILMDQMMPHMSGPQTLARMREAGEENKSKDARVIAFTADAIAGARERLMAQGFDDYLSKPVTFQSLLRVLTDHLPQEKQLKPGMKGYEEARIAAGRKMEQGAEKSSGQVVLEQLSGIDLAEALAICGTKEVLLAAVRDFYLTIDSQSDLIERYLRDGDIKNYTIKVHALKSAANFIGARNLSDDAAYLERMGNKGNTEEMEARTPPLLALYRSYKEKLAAIDPDAEKEEKEEITTEELLDAYEEIRLFAEAFDFDGIDAVMETLSAYRIPEKEKERFGNIRLQVTNVDREALLRTLDGISASAP